jgi:hypothetical protein
LSYIYIKKKNPQLVRTTSFIGYKQLCLTHITNYNYGSKYNVVIFYNVFLIDYLDLDCFMKLLVYIKLHTLILKNKIIIFYQYFLLFIICI